MQCEIDPDICLPEAKWPGNIRTHPWLYSKKYPEDRQYDFKNRPELIPHVMTEWVPWSHYEAVQYFYRLLKWLNVESPFETNDSRFYGPMPTKGTKWEKTGKKLYCRGLMMLFFDKLWINLSSQSEAWATQQQPIEYLPTSKNIEILAKIVQGYLHLAKPNFQGGIVQLSYFPTKFLILGIPEQQQYGYELRLRFFSYGDTEEEVMENLELTFRGIRKALRKTAEDVREAHPDYAEGDE